MALILIVDDDPAVRDSIATILGLDAHEVMQAKDGLECERAVERRMPDLIILDIFMPQQEGIETIRSLRRRHRDVRILAISGGGETYLPRSLRFAREFGADAALEKPFVPSALRELVRSLIAAGES
jgi:CheY-like chemotaxis protein